MEKTSPRIVVVGDIYLHWIAHPHQFPASGETVPADNASWHVGGRGAVQAIAASRLGTAVSLMAPVGKDLFAESLRQALAHEKVGVDGLVQDEHAATGVAFTWLNSIGQFRSVHAPGANKHLPLERIEKHSHLIASAAYVLLTSGIPDKSAETAARLARRAGAKVMLDPGPDMTVSEELMHSLDYLVLNEDTLAILSKAPLCDFSQAIATIKARELRNHAAATVIVKLGPLGALLVSNDLEHMWRPPTGVNGDVTQAGDLFTAAFATALASGKSELSAGKFAVAAATANSWRPGQAPCYPSLHEVENLLKPHPRPKH
jgi:ribokinase